MISLVRFALALIAAGQVPSGSPPAPESETAATATKLDIDERTGTWHLKDNAVVNTGTIEVRADEIWFDPAAERVIGRGHVILFQENIVAFAEEMDVQLTTGEAALVGGTVLQKRNVSSQALLKAKTREELEKLGQTTMSVTGRHVRRLGPDHYSVDGIAFTPCDCDPVKPSWRIKSLHADVMPGERAILTLPVIYIRGVPLLAFPWLYVPMSDRRSGLLIPRWGSAAGSFFLEQPVFVTLGRSYDTTISPGYYFGSTDASGLPVGVKGPRLQTEFEYAPSTRTKGRATLDLLYDLSARVGTDSNGQPTALPNTTRGLRGSGALRHEQDLGRGGPHHSGDALHRIDGGPLPENGGQLCRPRSGDTSGQAIPERLFRRRPDDRGLPEWTRAEPPSAIARARPRYSRTASVQAFIRQLSRRIQSARTPGGQNRSRSAFDSIGVPFDSCRVQPGSSCVRGSAARSKGPHRLQAARQLALGPWPFCSTHALRVVPGGFLCR